MRSILAHFFFFGLTAVLGFTAGIHFAPTGWTDGAFRSISASAVQAPSNASTPSLRLLTGAGSTTARSAVFDVPQAGMAQKGQSSSAVGINTLADLKDWIGRDPAAALKWYADGGWRVVGDSSAQIGDRLRELGAAIAENRGLDAFGQRMAWSSVGGRQPERLLAQWKADGGSALAGKINSSPNGTDMMWSVAMQNPSQAWGDTAEWVSGLKVDPNEQAALIEQLAQESLKAGEGGQAAVVFGSHQEPVFDRAKAALVVGLAQSSPSLAKTAWDGLSSPAARLSAAIQVLANPKTATATIQMVGQWAHDSGLQLSGPFQ